MFDKTQMEARVFRSNGENGSGNLGILGAVKNGIVGRRTGAEPMIVHLAGIALDIVILRAARDYFDIFAGDD